MDLKGLVWTLAGTYNVVKDPGGRWTCLPVRGCSTSRRRSTGSSARIWGGSFPARTGTSEAKATKTDGIVGVKGRFNFGDNREWFVPYYFDIGTGRPT